MMISTAQIAPVTRPTGSAAPPAAAASDAFAEVLALLTTDLAPIPSSADLDASAVARPAAVLIAEGEGDRTPPHPSQGAGHRHAVRATSPDTDMVLPLAAALADPIRVDSPAAFAQETVLQAEPPLTESNPALLPTNAAILAEPPVLTIQPVPNALLSQGLTAPIEDEGPRTQVPTTRASGPMPQVVADRPADLPLKQSSPAAPPTLLQPDEGVRKPAAGPVTSADPLPRAATGRVARPLPPAPTGQPDTRPVAGAPAGLPPVVRTEKVEVSEDGVHQPATLAARNVKAPELSGLGQQPAAKVALPPPVTPQVGRAAAMVLLAPRRSAQPVSIQAAVPVADEAEDQMRPLQTTDGAEQPLAAPGAAGRVQTSHIETAETFGVQAIPALSGSPLPQTEQRPMERVSLLADRQDPAQVAPDDGGLVTSTPALGRTAAAPVIVQVSYAPAPVAEAAPSSAPEGPVRAVVPPANAPREPRLGVTAKGTRVGVASSDPAPTIKSAATYPILTPAQAFSRFQTMLDDGAFAGRAPASPVPNAAPPALAGEVVQMAGPVAPLVAPKDTAQKAAVSAAAEPDLAPAPDIGTPDPDVHKIDRARVMLTERPLPNSPHRNPAPSHAASHEAALPEAAPHKAAPRNPTPPDRAPPDTSGGTGSGPAPHVVENNDPNHLMWQASAPAASDTRPPQPLHLQMQTDTATDARPLAGQAHPPVMSRLADMLPAGQPVVPVATRGAAPAQASPLTSGPDLPTTLSLTLPLTHGLAADRPPRRTAAPPPDRQAEAPPGGAPQPTAALAARPLTLVRFNADWQDLPRRSDPVTPAEVPLDRQSVGPPDRLPDKLADRPSDEPSLLQSGLVQAPRPAHPAAVAAVPPHIASPVDHTRHSLPTGFSTNLAHSVLDSGHSRAELILEPAELGRLRFDLVTQGDQVQVTLAAERPETLDLLRRHADELRQEFRASGLDTGTLSFGQWGKGGDDRALPDQPVIDRVADDPQLLSPTARSAPRLPASGAGLDLRL